MKSGRILIVSAVAALSALQAMAAKPIGVEEANVKQGRQTMQWRPLTGGQGYELKLTTNNKDKKDFEKDTADGIDANGQWAVKKDEAKLIEFGKDMKPAVGTKNYRPRFNGKFVQKKGNVGRGGQKIVYERPAEPVWKLDTTLLVKSKFLAQALALQGEKNKAFSVLKLVYSATTKKSKAAEYKKPSPVNPFYFDVNLDGDACDDKDELHPICYSQNEKIKARIVLAPLDGKKIVATEIKIKGSCPLGVIPIHDGFVAKNNTIVSKKLVLIPKALPKEAKHYPSFRFDWQVNIDGGGWQEAGSTAIEVFVVHGNPGPYRFRSILYHATRNGGSKPKEYVANTWKSMKELGLMKWDGNKCGEYSVPLYYYKGMTPTDLKWWHLLRKPATDGNCVSFASFFCACLSVNGIPAKSTKLVDFYIMDLETKEPAKLGQFPIGFFVQNYKLNKPHKAMLTNGKWQYLNDGVSALNQQGIPGQNMLTPKRKGFPSHTVVKIGKDYYDPSYGKIHAGPADFAKKSIACYYYLQPTPPQWANRFNPKPETRTHRGITYVLPLAPELPAGSKIMEKEHREAWNEM